MMRGTGCARRSKADLPHNKPRRARLRMRWPAPPGRAVVRIAHAIDEPAKLRGGDGDDIVELVGKALPRRVPVLDRREHRAQEQHRAIRILMVRAHHLLDQIHRVATDLFDRRSTLEPEMIAAFDGQPHRHAAHVIEREGRIKKPQEGPERTTRIIVLGLAKQQG